MTTRGAVGVLFLLFLGCSPPLGRVRVSVVFDNETTTRCIQAAAKTAGGVRVAGTPASIPREGKDTLLIGVGETSDLRGEVFVTISRFASADCTGTAFASDTKSAQVVSGAATATLEFVFRGTATDGGVDGGSDGGFDDGGTDGGLDGGCDLTACANAPGDCETLPATGCAADGGCRFGFAAAQSACSGGVCNSMGTCLANVCAVLSTGSSCDDGLSCTATSTCQSGTCLGNCGTPPECNRLSLPISCNPNDASKCALVPSNDFATCQSSADRQCLGGVCRKWIGFPAQFNLRSTLGTVTYPTAGWALASTDGGVCDTIISTGPSAPSVMTSDCGAPTLSASIDDAGVAVLTMTSLDIGPNARLQFVGTRPVQLLVLGSANINGVLSVAPLLGGQQPAGTQPSTCSAVQNGAVLKAAGGGGGFGGNGGTGGEAGGSGGNANATLSPLRGGCAGGTGFRATATQSAAGTGGGALDLIVADTLTLDGGVVSASGGGGVAGTTDGEGAGGGGSGGTIIIEASVLHLNNGAVTANGGGGAEGGDTGQISDNGALGPLASSTGAPAANSVTSGGGIGGTGGDNGQQNGGNGGDGGGGKGGGGGGGSAGIIFIRGHTSCVRGNGVLSGAQPQGISCL